MANGTDVKLLPGQVKVEAWDLCLDSQDRRKNQSQYRRALVHDFDDGLTLNWNYDYPAGVTIRHLKKIYAKGKTMSGSGATHLTIEGNVRNDGNLGVNGRLKANGPLDILLYVVPPGKIKRPPQGISNDEFEGTSGSSLEQILQYAQQGDKDHLIKVDAIDAIATLSEMVLDLTVRVSTLEKG